MSSTTAAPKADPGRIKPPLHEQRRPDKERNWTSHWPLPVSLLLAIVYWLYLNEQVSRKVTPELAVEVIGPNEDHAKKGLSIRKPTDDYIITKITRPDGKPFDTARERVRFTINAPGSHLKRIDTNLSLIAEIEIPAVTGSFDERRIEWTLTKKDVKDATGELTSFIGEMDPPELRVHLQRSMTASLELRLKHVRLLPSEGPWANRLFRDSLEFGKDFVNLTGPLGLVQSLVDDEPKEVFVMDLRDKLPKIVSSAPDERKPVTARLRLLPELKAAGITVDSLPQASIRVAPEPKLIKGITLEVEVDWRNSTLNAETFKVDTSVEVEIRSYNRELSQLLGDQEAGKRWIDENLRCRVRVADVDPALDTTKPDFVAHLQPYYMTYDRDFREGRDFKILNTSLIQITRKQDPMDR